MSDYVYRNRNDTLRFNITRYGTHWNYYVFDRRKQAMISFAEEAGAFFRTKRDALDDIRTTYGAMVSINPKGRVTEGWDEW